jgi:hypothetical protein
MSATGGGCWRHGQAAHRRPRSLPRPVVRLVIVGLIQRLSPPKLVPGAKIKIKGKHCADGTTTCEPGHVSRDRGAANNSKNVGDHTLDRALGTDHLCNFRAKLSGPIVESVLSPAAKRCASTAGWLVN